MFDWPRSLHQPVKDKSCETLNKVLRNFFKLESLPKYEEMVSINNKVEELFKSLVKRNSDSRYIVKLPFKKKKDIGESK